MDALDRNDIATLWALAKKAKGTILKRGQRGSESEMEFEKRATQYDLIIVKLEAMSKESGPLPGTTNGARAVKPVVKPKVVGAVQSTVRPVIRRLAR